MNLPKLSQHTNIYTTFVPSRSSVEGEELLEVGSFKFVVVNRKSYFFGRINRENIFLDKVF